jgi:rhomboid protease GluP
MFKRQTSGSVVCVSCGYLVGVKDDKCYHCGRRNPALFGFAPALRSLGHDLGFVPFVTGLCAVMFILSLAWGGISMRGGLFGFLSPARESLFFFGASGAAPVFEAGRWWTFLSATWLHGSLVHIVFNVMWIRQLAPDVGELYGPGRMVIIYVVAGVFGFAASSTAGEYLRFLPWPLSGAGMTVGASASIFGLLGALVYYGRRSGSRHVHAQAMSWALAMFVFGLIMPGIDNYGHAGGFAGGYLAGRFLDPLHPEQINHIFIALILLSLSVLAILVSVVHGIQFFS